MSDTRSDADPALTSSEAGSRASPLPRDREAPRESAVAGLLTEPSRQTTGAGLLTETPRQTVGAGLPANSSPVRRLADFYETLTPASLATLDQYYAPDARFKDPFNEVTGTTAIRRIFEHMFATTDAPRFVVTDCIEQGEQAMLGWEFHFALRGRALTVRGVTHLRFDADGRVTLHRDYWDAAEELYEKLPLLGGVMRLIKRRLAVSSTS